MLPLILLGAAYLIEKSLQPDTDNYHLGGDMSKHLAPNGKPSKLTHEQWHLVRTPAFKKWFGDWENDAENASKVVDEETKEPLVVYHFTKQNFYSFDNSLLGKETKTNDTGIHASSLLGFWFNSNKNFYKSVEDEFNIKKVFLNIRDFREINKLSDLWQTLQRMVEDTSETYNSNGDEFEDDIEYKSSKEIAEMYLEYYISYEDGIFILNDTEFGGSSFIAFYPTQIKLADGTNTTFDGSNPDIRFEDGGEVGTFKIDGKEATKEEFIKILQEENERDSFNLNPKKIEYNGDDEQIKESINSYNIKTNPYTNKELKENYMKTMVQDAFSKLSFRKFGDIYRKNIDKNFSSERNQICLTGGRTWQDFASYIIWDGSFDVEENEFRGFAKDLGITIPPNNY